MTNNKIDFVRLVFVTEPDLVLFLSFCMTIMTIYYSRSEYARASGDELTVRSRYDSGCDYLVPPPRTCKVQFRVVSVYSYLSIQWIRFTSNAYQTPVRRGQVSILRTHDSTIFIGLRKMCECKFTKHITKHFRN